MNRDLVVSDPQILLDRVRTEFPSLTWTNYEFITHSWEYQVLILDNHLVFRFPTSSELLPNLRREIALFEYIHIPEMIGIPKYTFIAKDYSFAGYPIVQGKELTRTVYEQLNNTQRRTAQEHIALFLRRLHDTLPPEDSPLFATTHEDLRAEDMALLRKLMPLLHQKLNKEELAAAEATIKAAANLRQSTIAPVLIHGDFYHKHILWDTDRSSIGVIDFGDCNLGDPALDFAELYEYGADFVYHIALSYTDKSIRELLHRAVIFYRRVGVFLMINAIEDVKVDFDYAHGIFTNAHMIKL